MRFDKLRVLGFKSFVEPCEFILEQGLTGVVGPNGCGKSNLVEAMRWVMGENSYKNMRASGMDDVIFSGSAKRPARNMAEVALYLDNADRSAPAAFNDSDEIQVTRRIARESGSVYRINGREVRARDVQLLFADASTGARSPSMVGQGRIGELIQAKPQARRQLLEEAAGIAGLHSRRHEAELRLRAAESNLERLDDVIAELESRIDNLKRQARQAKRFKVLSADIRKAEATLLHIRWVEAKEMEAQTDQALTKATSDVAEHAQAQAEAAKAQAVASLKLPELRDAQAGMAARLQRLQIARSQLDEVAERARRRRAELERRLAQLKNDLDRESVLIRDNEAALSRLAAESDQLQALETDTERMLPALQEAFQHATALLSDSEKALTGMTAQRAQAEALAGQLERQMHELTGRKTRIEGQMAEARREENDLAARIAVLPDPADRQKDVAVAEAGLSALDEDIARAERSLADARDSEATARRHAEAAGNHLNTIETEARTIAAMLNAGQTGDLFAPVVERIRVDKGYETALGAALGEDLDLSLDPLAPAHWGDSGSPEDDPALPDGLDRLADFVDAPPVLARRLAQIAVVEPAIAKGLLARLKPGQRLVSREGGLWRWDGVVRSIEAPSAAALRLAQKNRLFELDAERAEAEDRVQSAQAHLSNAAEKTSAADRVLKQARETHKSAVQRLGEARAALLAAEKAHGQLASRRAVIAQTIAQAQAQLQEVELGFDAARRDLAEAPDTGALDLALKKAEADVATHRAVLVEARADLDGVRRDKAMRARRLAAIAEEKTAWQGRVEAAHAQIATLTTRIEESESELSGVDEDPDETDRQRRSLSREIEAAEAMCRQAGDALALAETRQREADRTANDALAALSQAREMRGRAEERLLAARARRDDMEARIRDALDCMPHEVFQATGLARDDDLPKQQAVETKIERLRLERERLGAVNLRAEEEQQELSARLQTILAERLDVIEAIARLRAAIQSLNREGRARLLAAFDLVNGHFERLFKHLFGGGTAQLQLVESDDPLESGLEILARPPGKKLQTMTLLSGGEQALTATALIFAVFLTNPAPVCVLDEVDAPLDDHNVERFCNLMDEMAATTQTRFVIITHNPITMARMNRLFGVTMAEQGVSRLVSVDLQTAEQLREAV